MFNFIVKKSLDNRLFVLVAAALLVVYGLLILKDLPVDVFPDLNRPVVTLLTEVEGLAPEEVEQTVTFPIETAMNGMPGVTRVRSVSSAGLSIVFVEFDWGSDVFLNRQLVSERLALVREQLPRDVLPQMGPISSIMGEIMLVAVSSETESPMDVREVADWVVRPRLLTIPGVAQVIAIGGDVRQYRVTPDISALKQLGLPLETVEHAIQNFSDNTGGGFVDQRSREWLIRNIARTTRLEDLRNLVVAHREQQPVLLRQVAEVAFGAQVKRGDAGYMAKPAVILSIQKQPGADTVELTKRIEDALQSLARIAPPGVSLNNVLFKQSNFIEKSINNVERVLVEAAVAVTLVLFIFLLNVRTTFISLVAIPLSILFTAIIFRWFELSINTMTLGGIAIAIGTLVDDAVVYVENIYRRLRQNQQGAKPRPVDQVVYDASLEVRSGILYATVIIILVFIPLFSLSGIEGRLFTPLGVAYIISILASLLIAITVTPVLSYYLLPRGLPEKETFVVSFFKRVNEKVLLWAMRRPAAPITAAFLTFAVAVAAGWHLPRTFLPPFNEGTLTINLLLDPGISLAESSRIGALAERLVMVVPEVSRVGRRTGRAELDEHAAGVHSSELDVDLRQSGRTRVEIMQDVRNRLSVLPVLVNVGQPISHRLDHMLSGIRAQVAVKIFGQDIDTLRTVAGSVARRLSTVEGLVDLQVEKQVRIPQVQVRFDYEKAVFFGVTPGLVTELLESLSNGRVISHVIDGTRRFDVVMRLSDTDRTARRLAQLLVETPVGRVPLRSFADVIETDGPNQIMRENGQRRIVVLANTSGADTSEVVAEIREVLDRFELPQGYFFSLEGTFQAQEEGARMISGLSAISLFLIFLVLYNRYRSTALALIIMGNVPLALIGSVAALWIADQPLSLASMIGFITLVGISTRNGILKISQYINLALHEGERFGERLVVRGSQERLIPVLMTALTACFALVPLLIGADAPGKEILHPVAVVIFGGLISATLLDAVLTPVLFKLLGAKPLERLRRQAEAGGLTEQY